VIFFDGLHSYEVIMLISGVIVLLVLLVALLRRIWTNESFSGLLPFFAVPVVMIGYSSIQSITFQKDVLTINKTTDALKQDPNNPTLRATLQNDVAKLSARPATSANAMAVLGRAQLALGNEDEAKQNLAKAQQVEPNLPAVQELNRRIQLGDQLEALTSKVESAPNDVSSKTALESTVKQLESGGVANPKTLGNIAKAQSVLGNSQQAVSVANRALQIDPGLRSAQQVIQKSKVMNQQMLVEPQH
jgi:tetratricopeptide (TPR) repeat protein